MYSGQGVPSVWCMAVLPSKCVEDMRDKSQSKRWRRLFSVYPPIGIIRCVYIVWNLIRAVAGAFHRFATPVGENTAGQWHDGSIHSRWGIWEKGVVVKRWKWIWRESKKRKIIRKLERSTSTNNHEKIKCGKSNFPIKDDVTCGGCFFALGRLKWSFFSSSSTRILLGSF